MSYTQKERQASVKKKKYKHRRFIPYDYETAYNKALDDMHEWFTEQLLRSHRTKVVYALKEITAGEQFEIDIYPQFKSMDDVPAEGRRIIRDNSKAQKNLNDRHAREYVERLINANFTDNDIWLTLTYDNKHLPIDGDIDGAMKDVQRYIRRINYERSKFDLPNARYIYVTEYDPDADIRWHHHIVMDGALPMDVLEEKWGMSSRNNVRRLEKDENGLSGMANYIVKNKDRFHGEKRWKSSKGLLKPGVRVVHTKRPAQTGNYKPVGAYVDKMVRDHEAIKEQLLKWYPAYDFTNAQVYYNDFNGMFYIHARMRKKPDQQQERRHGPCLLTGNRKVKKNTTKKPTKLYKT